MAALFLRRMNLSNRRSLLLLLALLGRAGRERLAAVEVGELRVRPLLLLAARRDVELGNSLLLAHLPLLEGDVELAQNEARRVGDVAEHQLPAPERADDRQAGGPRPDVGLHVRSEEHTSEL